MNARMPDPWFVYLLRCVDDTLYCGITNDLDRRTAAHQAGQVKYTRGRRPVSLVWTEPAADRSEASRRELAVKRLDRRQKLALIAAADGRAAS
ncbi:GIY-YIG nuclease family protein [Myxococcota bacterium]|jgi:putative endonuclease|nr:GIY-YIG nuclease family protein [Myxococcota bacterium]